MIETDIEQLSKLLGKTKVSSDPQKIADHKPTLFLTSQSKLFDVICYPESTEDVLAIVNFAIEKQIPVVAYGAGTSVEGQVAAPYGGICIDMRKMNRVLVIDQENLFVTVEAGLAYNDLNQILLEKNSGLYFPVEAGWGATIGGMAATNASGAGAYWVGSMRDNIIGGEAVTYLSSSQENSYHAQRILFGRTVNKSSTGIDLTGLFVGSEGTLGILTQLTLKLRPIAQVNTAFIQFDNLQDAVNYVLKIRSISDFYRIEFLDAPQYAACVEYCQFEPEFSEKNKFTLLLEFKNSDDISQQLRNALPDSQKKLLHIISDVELARKIWWLRKNAGIAANKTSKINNPKIIVTDTCVHLTKFSEFIAYCYAELEKTQPRLYAPVVAHIGDGNVHFSIVVDQEDPVHVAIAKDFAEKLGKKAILLGGTCSGEHGIGLGKKELLRAEKGDAYLSITTKIKNQFDPIGILNPGVLHDHDCEFNHPTCRNELCS
jgi:D-lactate dehydrogenase (cytochrome)